MTNGHGDKLTLIQLLPNMITVTAIVAGLTAIRFGLQGNYELAVQLILLAAILDGVDGRLARALGSDSKMGAELDSLAAASAASLSKSETLGIRFFAISSNACNISDIFSSVATLN